MKQKITVAYGDGIGPEIMNSSLTILKEAGAVFDEDVIEIGEKVYKQGYTSGLKDEDWDKIVNNKVFYKAPITTPQGGGYKSLNVTIRKTLGLFANVRPIKTLTPFVHSKHETIDSVIIRENEEDLYAGIEHRQTQEVYQCLKLISRPGSEKIVRYAFEYAKNNGRKKVTCMVKDNIMKLTDGLFHEVFNEVAKEYPDIEADRYIVDIGMARFADSPEIFDVVVLPNLYGDILSDIGAQIAGSVGLDGSSNIGEHCAMFEAIHGSAPDIAGQSIANPSGLLMGGVMMLNHLGQNDIAARVENAWLKTLEDGVHTKDIFSQEHSKIVAKTEEFTKEVINRLGDEPKFLKPKKVIKGSKPVEIKTKEFKKQKKEIDGVDIFVCEDNRDPEALAVTLNKAAENHDLKLQMITNRGVKVYPNGNPHTFCTDHWRCRFKFDKQPNTSEIYKLLITLNEQGVDVIKTENLYLFDTKPGYSLGQGQ